VNYASVRMERESQIENSCKGGLGFGRCTLPCGWALVNLDD